MKRSAVPAPGPRCGRAPLASTRRRCRGWRLELRLLPETEARLSDDGEILIKSPGQFSGYYRQPELTAECFTEDGVFRTGDLGEQRPHGMLRLTGRRKELFKTAKGKYVAPAPIENLLNAHPMVEMSIVSGAGQAAACAVAVLGEALGACLPEPGVRGQALAPQVRGWYRTSGVTWA